MAVTYTIQGRLDGLNDYTRSCRTNAYKGADCKKKNQRICKYSIPLWLRKKKLNFPVIVEITWYEKNKRRDPDNVAFAKKFILDSLVESGVLAMDSQKYVSALVDHFRVDPENPRIEITIYENGEFDIEKYSEKVRQKFITHMKME